MLCAGGRTTDTSRLLRSLRSAVAVALLLVLAACGLGDRGSTAQVEGLQYEISVARSLQAGEADLEVYGQVSGYTDPAPLGQLGWQPPELRPTSGSQALTNTHRYDPWGQAIGGSGSAYNPSVSPCPSLGRSRPLR